MLFCLAAPADAAVETATADPAAVALLAKHRAFVGWDASDQSVTSWVATYTRPGRARAAGAKPAASASPQAVATPRPTASIEYRRGLVYREDYDRFSSGLQRGTGFTGRFFWNANQNGFAVRMVDIAAKRAFSRNLVLAEATTLIPLAHVRGKIDVDGTPTSIVRILPANGVPVDLYIDDAGAYRRVVIDPEAKYEAEDLVAIAYTSIAPGKKAMSAFRLAESARPTLIAYAHVNEPIDDAKLSVPKPGATWTFDEAQGTVPIVIQHSSPYNNGVGAVIVEAAIDGHTGHFLLDSGAGSILLFHPFVDQLTNESLATGGYGGVAGGSVRSDSIRIKALTIGKNTLHDVVVEKSSQKSFEDIDGIIGFDIFAKAIVDVDLGGLTLAIMDPAKVEPAVGKGAYAFPIDLSDFHIRVPVQIGSGNGVVIHPYIDTGASFDVLISDDLRNSGKVVALTNQISISGQKVDDIEYFGGVDGVIAIPVPCVRLNAMRVGPYAYNGVHTCFASHDVFAEDGGLIGFDFLRHFNWTFDYPDEKLVLTPNGK